MTETLQQAGLFLINTVFNLYLFVLVIRFLLALSRANYFNPLTQVILKLTRRLIDPLRRVIPNFRSVELAVIVVILLVIMMKYFLIGFLSQGMPHFPGLFLLAFAEFLELITNVFLYSIFLLVILSWIQPGFTPISGILQQLVQPVMRPLKRIIPPVAGFDLTPIPAIIILQLVMMLLVNPLLAMGMQLTFK